MYLGQFQHNVDAKGRLIIPSKFRNQLGDNFVITMWMEKSLFVFPETQWKQLEQKINNLPIGAKDARSFRRLVFSGAIEGEFDKQGRVNIPENLLKYAEIEKNVVITGAGEGFEIWSAQKWQDYTKDISENFDNIAEGLTDFNL